jgi:hypothetical protein
MKHFLSKCNLFAGRLRLFALILVLLSGVGISTDTYAQTIRGRLMKGSRPIIGVPVNVYSNVIGQSGFSYSGPDGMYYLFNIPPGQFILQIWDIPNVPPMQFQIYVHPQPWVDIAPIQVR